MSRFARFFRVEEQEETGDDLVKAHDIMEFASTRHFARFLEWLQAQADEPLSVGDHSDMIQQAVRANTLREVRTKLLRDLNVAREAVEAYREEPDV